MPYFFYTQLLFRKSWTLNVRYLFLTYDLNEFILILILIFSGFPGQVVMCLHVYVKRVGTIGKSMVVLKVKMMVVLMIPKKRW